MPDYQPIDLAGFCSVGKLFISPGADPPIGSQTFHGLPFKVGADDPDPTRCFIGFGGEAGLQDGSVTIPINATARRILFAHALLESQVMEGEKFGRVVAQYVFRFTGGEAVRVPIRERFEVGAVAPAQGGGAPFLAVPDQKESLMPRYQGEWSLMGRRQTEASRGGARGYYLWVWENPHPDRMIESIVLEPGGRKFLIAAITLAHVDEPPFCRTGKREVKITLPQAEDAEKPFQVEVDVDRGVATYPFPLPDQPADEFLSNDFKGWGEEQNPKSSPAYVEIAAIPSATVTVKNDGETLGQANWGELQEKGRVETPRVRLEVVDRGRNWVHVTVLDDETGKPVPCRVHFRSPDGIPYQPHGYHHHVNSNLGTWHVDIGGDLRLGQVTYAYIDGQCQGWLPRGRVIVDVGRGFEYEPLRTTVEIKPSQRDLVLRLKRWTNMNARRWFSGDSHVHFLGTQGAHREAQGEDLNVVNLLQSQWGHLFTNSEDFIGRPTVTQDGQTIVYCSQENRQHFLGHLILWGLKDEVMPWCTDGTGEAELGGTLEEAMSYWADKTHAQGGTVVIPHLPNPNCEPAVLIATGRADAVEMLRHGAYNHSEYYRYLNCGYRLPLVGGTDKMSSDVPVGIYRTYAYIPDDEEFNYDTWCQAVRAGRTFLSGGPLIHFTVNGAHVGDTLRLPGNGGTVEVEATAESIFPIHTLEIIQQGRVVASTEETKGVRLLRLKTALKVEGHTWLAARCGGPNYTAIPHHDGWRRGLFAHTSPLYIACGGEWCLFDQDAAQYMLTLVEGGLAYIRHTAAHYPSGSVTHHHGEDDHLAYLERPFLEAQKAIHQRMHELGIAH
ncbi:MAG: CehA/McbA family metallohydrolase [Candidatus Latescibacteria bacterium]|nr:CehA/McbA family metallohydrolase [Candidatus Latescibacterota bacterium]